MRAVGAGGYCKGTIGEAIAEMILQRHSDEVIMLAVQQRFPHGKIDRGRIAWYRSQLRKRRVLPALKRAMTTAQMER